MYHADEQPFRLRHARPLLLRVPHVQGTHELLQDDPRLLRILAQDLSPLLRPKKGFRSATCPAICWLQLPHRPNLNTIPPPPPRHASLRCPDRVQ